MTGAEMIAAERQRQIAEEGWTPEHDSEEHGDGDLAFAAICYAQPEEDRQVENGLPFYWPWEDSWKPTPNDRIRELVKAGALIAAEIDRLQRQAEK